MDNFEGYDDHKGFWFLIMLTIGQEISKDSTLSVNSTGEPRLEEALYKWLQERKKKTRVRKRRTILV
jgi:hypothetical protein